MRRVMLMSSPILGMSPGQCSRVFRCVVSVLPGRDALGGYAGLRRSCLCVWRCLTPSVDARVLFGYFVFVGLHVFTQYL